MRTHLRIPEAWLRGLIAPATVIGLNVLLPKGRGGWPWNWLASNGPKATFWIYMGVAGASFVYHTVAGVIKAAVVAWKDWADDQ